MYLTVSGNRYPNMRGLADAEADGLLDTWAMWLQKLAVVDNAIFMNSSTSSYPNGKTYYSAQINPSYAPQVSNWLAQAKNHPDAIKIITDNSAPQYTDIITLDGQPGTLSVHTDNVNPPLFSFNNRPPELGIGIPRTYTRGTNAVPNPGSGGIPPIDNSGACPCHCQEVTKKTVVGYLSKTASGSNSIPVGMPTTKTVCKPQETKKKYYYSCDDNQISATPASANSNSSYAGSSDNTAPLTVPVAYQPNTGTVAVPTNPTVPVPPPVAPSADVTGSGGGYKTVPTAPDVPVAPPVVVPTPVVESGGGYKTVAPPPVAPEVPVMAPPPMVGVSGLSGNGYFQSRGRN